MAAIRAMRDATPDPKTGTQRRTSGVGFPYYDLAKSIEVAKVIHEKAGGACDRAQLAHLLGYKGTDNGSFLTRVTAAKTFGLIEQDGISLRVTDRGQAIISPVMDGDSERAKLEAFLAVDLFRKVYEQFEGKTLPPLVGLQNLLKTQYQVVPDRAIPTVRVMMDSADQAGLFMVSGNRTKMILPLQSAQPPEVRVIAEPAVGAGQMVVPEIGRSSGNGGGRGGGGGGGFNIHPAILGLLTELPEAGTTLSTKKRKALIDAFTHTVGWIYPESEDGM